jgi:hypothetical protein
MRDKLNLFVENTQGEFQEVSSKSAIYQCMDLAYEWIFCLGFPKATIQNLYAYEVFTKPKQITFDYFELIPNTPDGFPIDGDLVVWKGGEAGHIAIALSGSTKDRLLIYEQNNPLGTNPHIQERSYKNVLGWLRPRIKFLGVQEITDQTKINIGGDFKEMEVQAIRSMLNDLWSDKKTLSEQLIGMSSSLKTERESRQGYEQFVDKLWEELKPVGKDKSTENILAEVKNLTSSDSTIQVIKTPEWALGIIKIIEAFFKRGGEKQNG